MKNGDFHYEHTIPLITEIRCRLHVLKTGLSEESMCVVCVLVITLIRSTN